MSTQGGNLQLWSAEGGALWELRGGGFEPPPVPVRENISTLAGRWWPHCGYVSMP